MVDFLSQFYNVQLCRKTRYEMAKKGKYVHVNHSLCYSIQQ